jgi:hypothetical protein
MNLSIKFPLLLLPLKFLLISVSYGQIYEPFIDTDNQWNTMVTYYGYGGSPTTKNTLLLQIAANDTLINDTVYQKVVNTGYSDGAYPTGDIGFIREDIDEKKIFFRENWEVFYPPKDRLLYDFSLEIGDTTEVYGLHHCLDNSNTYKVVSMGTIHLLNDEERKTWHLESIGHNPQETDLWIEGIGSLNGMLFPGCSQMATTSFSIKLLCYYEDDLKLYMSDEDSCYIDWTTGLEAYEENNITLYPNPARNQVTLSLPDEIQYGSTYQIYHVNGTKLVEGRLNEKSVTIPLGNMKPGMYFFNVQSNTTVFRSKLIINN